MARLPAHGFTLSLLLACALPFPAAAQTIGYGSVGDSEGGSEAGDSGSGGSGSGKGRAQRPRDNPGKKDKYVKLEPYIEVSQAMTKYLDPGDDVLTYTIPAIGVDATAVGLNNAGSLSLRYEHRFGLSRNAEDGDQVTGVARAYTTMIPGIKIDAGALAVRSWVDENGGTVMGPLFDDDRVTQIYSGFAGPSVHTNAGDVEIKANYRLGYTRVEAQDSFVVTPGGTPADFFDDSVVHSADIHAGVKPGTVVPVVGIGAGAGYYREDVSNLDQRVEDFHGRVDVTIPVAHSVALVAGVGYEDVTISARDAVYGADGRPLTGPGGHYVIDKSAPRALAYDTEGFIWDAGVIWRPSRRTALEAHIGRRYGSTSVYGSLAYAPSSRSAFNVSVYDNIAGYGGRVNTALVNLPTEFTAVRNPLSGNIGGCVASMEGNNCLTSALGSVRSATFRARGVMASYSVELSRISAGIGAGYDRRKFIAAQGTVLAAINGVIDENYWVMAYLDGKIGDQSGFRTGVHGNMYRSGDAFGSDTTDIGASASLYHNLTNKLSASAALGISSLDREAPLQDYLVTSALLGMRYSF